MTRVQAYRFSRRIADFNHYAWIFQKGKNDHFIVATGKDAQSTVITTETDAVSYIKLHSPPAENEPQEG